MNQRFTIQPVEGIPEVIINLLQPRRLQTQIQLARIIVIQSLEAETLDCRDTGNGYANRW